MAQQIGRILPLAKPDEARMVSCPRSERSLIESLMSANYNAKSEQALLFAVATWDANCPQHIPQRFEASDVAESLKSRDRKIAELEAEIKLLKSIQTRKP